MVMLERPVEVNELLDGLIARVRRDLVSRQGVDDGIGRWTRCCWTALLPTSPVPSVKRSGRFFDRETSSCWKATRCRKTTFTQGLARGMGIGGCDESDIRPGRELGREEGLALSRTSMPTG